MKVIKKILFMLVMVVGLTITVTAQKDPKRPPKQDPPVVNPQQKNPPKENTPDSKRRKKSDYSYVVSKRAMDETA